ncbi:hypothetical protein FOCC_FOCC011141 [Frankliniella occidentalis]|nr:hypothetical protein FOCC_FOCC011141 [Frankliniella occidentalis]
MPKYTKRGKVKPDPKKKRRLKNLRPWVDRGMKGQLPNRQSQMFIKKAWNFFRRERLHGGPLCPVQKVRQRVADCLGISRWMASKYRDKKGEEIVPLTPGKDRSRKRPKRDVDDFVKKAIKNIILRLNRNGTHFTIKSLLSLIRDAGLEFDGEKETLRKILHDIGFFFEKRNGHLFLKEKPRNAALRYKFLKLFKLYKDEKSYARKYLDETWIFQYGSGVSFIWTNGEWECQRSKKAEGGARYIVAHVGGEMGFVEDALPVYHSKSKPKPGDDYHGDMNSKIFSTFMRKKVLPHTEEPSVFIMDNASYHKFQDPKYKKPTKGQNKDVMVAWLALHGVVADESYTKKSLYELIQQVDVEPVYPIIRMIQQAGHAVIFTPPYYPEYQPIELVWGIAKRYYDAHVDEIPMRWPHLKHSEAVILLWKEAIGTITKKVWAECVRHVEDRIMQDHSEIVGNFGEWTTPTPIVIRVGKDSDDSDSDPDDPEENSPASGNKDPYDDLATPLPLSPSSDHGLHSDDRIVEGDNILCDSQNSISIEDNGAPDKVLSPQAPLVEYTSVHPADALSIHPSVMAQVMKEDTNRPDCNNNEKHSADVPCPTYIPDGDIIISSDDEETLFVDGYRHPLKDIEVDIFDCHLVLIPVHLGMHWCLCVVEPQARTLTYYDSLNGRNITGLRNVLRYLSDESKRKGHPFIAGQWRMFNAVGICRQPEGNDYDCGVFVCYYARMKVDSCSTFPTVVLYDNPIVHHWEIKRSGHGIMNNNGQNICFAASIVQALFNCAPFVAWLESDAEHRNACDQKHCTSCTLHHLYTETLKTSPDLSQLIECMSSFWPEYKLGQQQDAHEFLMKLFSNLEIQFQERFRDAMCHRESASTTVPFRVLSVNVQPSLIGSCKKFFEEEVVEGYKCKGCHNYVKALKRTSIDSAPEMLVIHLMRFSGTGQKLKIFVKFNPTLNVGLFMSTVGNVRYNFRSVVCHIGESTSSGHYVAVAQCPDQLFRKFNDSEVTSSSLQKAMQEPAYLLFYERDMKQ